MFDRSFITIVVIKKKGFPISMAQKKKKFQFLNKFSIMTKNF